MLSGAGHSRDAAPNNQAFIELTGQTAAIKREMER